MKLYGYLLGIIKDYPNHLFDGEFTASQAEVGISVDAFHTKKHPLIELTKTRKEF